MKKILYLLIISVVHISIVVSAETLDINREKEESTIPKHQFSLGAELYNYLYTEPTLMKKEGVLYGINGSYSYYLGQDYFTQIEVRGSRGKTSYSSNRTGSMKNEPNALFEGRLLLKRAVVLSPSVIINPYLGFGYRYKEDNENGKFTTTGHSSYHRKSQYYYLPIGIVVDYQLQNNWQLSMLGEYDMFLEGKQKSFSIYKTHIHKQSEGYGLRAEALVSKILNKYVVSIGPYIHYWNIKDSETFLQVCQSCGGVHGASIEPKNVTKETGVKIKFSF